MGNGGNASTWYLTSSKTWFTSIDVALLPGSKPVQAVTTDTLTVTYAGEGLAAPLLYFGRVANTVNADGTASLDVLSYWNDVKNVQAIASSAEKLFFDGFVHVDVMVGAETTDSSIVTLQGVKRGNVITGAGDDTITVAMVSNDPTQSWTEDFRIASGAGNDRITLGGLDVAEEVAGGNITYVRSIVGQKEIFSSGVGRTSWIDAGAGDDWVRGWDSRDNIIGGGDNGSFSLVGGGSVPGGFAWSVGGSVGKGGESVLYKIDLATGASTAIGNVSISLGWLGRIGGLDVDSLTFNAKDGQLYGFATKLGLFDALIKIDPRTGATSFVSLNCAGLRSENQDMSFDKAGNLYLASKGDFIQVNTTTGRTTVIGNNTLDTRIAAMAVDPATDKVWALAETGSKTILYEIDKASGRVVGQSLVAGLDKCSDIEGMSFGIDGRLWAVDRETGKIAVIDTGTHSAVYTAKTLSDAQQHGDGFEALAMGPAVYKPLSDIVVHGGDVLTGGGEADHFWYRAGDGVDTITDFVKGTDQLHLGGYSVDQIRVDVFHGNTFIRFTDTSPGGFVDNALIVLAGVTDFSAGDIILG